MACQHALQATISARSIDYHYPKSICLEPVAEPSGFFASIFHGRPNPATFNVELKNHTVMHQPINGSGRAHRVGFLEDHLTLDHPKLTRPEFY